MGYLDAIKKMEDDYSADSDLARNEQKRDQAGEDLKEADRIREKYNSCIDAIKSGEAEPDFFKNMEEPIDPEDAANLKGTGADKSLSATFEMKDKLREARENETKAIAQRKALSSILSSKGGGEVSVDRHNYDRLASQLTQEESKELFKRTMEE